MSFQVLENLYQRCTDRLEYRTRLAQSVFNVLQLLPREYHHEFVQRIDVFSKNQRVAARNYGIEIVPLILKGLDLSGPDPGPIVYPSDNDVTQQEAGNDAASSSGTDAMDVDKGSASDDNEEDESDSNSGSESETAPDRTKGKAKADKDPPSVEEDEKPERVPVLDALYRCVIRSCLDKAYSVRMRALFHLASLLEDDRHRELLFHHARKMFEECPKVFIGIVTEKDEEDGNNEAEEINENMFLDDSEIVIDNIILHIIVTGGPRDSAGVRKYAVIALQAYFPFITDEVDARSAVDCLKECCLDSSLMVRKQAAEALDYLLSSISQFRDVLEEGWLAAVLPMINDREQSVQHMISKIVTVRFLFDQVRDCASA
ncbi:HEAT repeat protein [Cooperia oncophora]